MHNQVSAPFLQSYFSVPQAASLLTLLLFALTPSLTSDSNTCFLFFPTLNNQTHAHTHQSNLAPEMTAFPMKTGIESQPAFLTYSG